MGGKAYVQLNDQIRSDQSTPAPGCACWTSLASTVRILYSGKCADLMGESTQGDYTFSATSGRLSAAQCTTPRRHNLSISLRHGLDYDRYSLV